MNLYEYAKSNPLVLTDTLGGCGGGGDGGIGEIDVDFSGIDCNPDAYDSDKYFLRGWKE